MVPFDRKLDSLTYNIHAVATPNPSAWLDKRKHPAQANATVLVRSTKTNESFQFTLEGDSVFAPPNYLLFGGVSGVMVRRPGGDAWTVAGTLPLLGSNEAMVEALSSEAGNSSLLMSLRVEAGPAQNGCRHFAVSHDGGVTWSEPWVPAVVNADTACVPDPTCQGSVQVLRDLPSSCGADPTVLAVGPGSKGNRGGTTVWLSRDGAKSFSLAAQLTNATDTGGYSDLTVLGTDGCNVTVGVIFEAAQGNSGGALAFARVWLSL